MRVLVAGAGGMVGRCVVAELGAHHEVLAADHALLDLADRDRVEQVVGTFRPDAVINCAAIADVDACERDPDAAYASNALALRYLGVAAARVDAHVVHISTDYVFDGTAGRAYCEWDATNPVQTYGRSKLAGEEELAAHASSWTVARTSWVLGPSAKDFAVWLLRQLSEGREARLVDDQTSTPTSAVDLAVELVAMAVGRRQGIVHAANAGACTRLELAYAVAELAGVEPLGFVAVSGASLGRPAARPAYSALDGRVLRLEGRTLRPYRDALADHVAAITAEPAPDELGSEGNS